MYVGPQAKRYTRSCGCSLAQDRDRLRYSAWLDVCPVHYDAGLDGLRLDLAIDCDATCGLACGCRIEHRSGAGTSWIPCAEHQEGEDGS